MTSILARICVPVALIASATSAAAASDGSRSVSAHSGSGTIAAAQTTVDPYWSASSEYDYAPDPGKTMTGGVDRHSRRILITGYHPAEGFADELAKEAENAAR